MRHDQHDRERSASRLWRGCWPVLRGGTVGLLILLPWMLAAIPSLRGNWQVQQQAKDFLFVQINLQLSADAMQALRKEPRQFVQGTVQINNAPPRAVKVRLKGAASFKPVDENPNWTIKATDQLSTELSSKVYLKNSQQDPSFLRRSLAAFVFQLGAVPSAREGFAWFSLNAKPPALCTLSEGLDKSTLQRLVGASDGALFEGHGEMGIRGLEPDNKAARSNAWPALAEQALASRSQKHTNVWDIFNRTNLASYIASELLLDDTDGYVFNLNNYRLWIGPGDGKAVVIPCDPEFAFGRGFNALLKRPVRGRTVALAIDDEQLAFETCREFERLCSFANEQATRAYMRRTASSLARQVSVKNPKLAKTIEMESQKLEAQIPARFAAARESATALRAYLESRTKNTPVPLDWSPTTLSQQPEKEGVWRAKASLVPGRYEIVVNLDARPSVSPTNAALAVLCLDNVQRKIYAASKENPLEMRYQFTVERPDSAPVMWAESKRFFVVPETPKFEVLAVKSKLVRLR